MEELNQPPGAINSHLPFVNASASERKISSIVSFVKTAFALSAIFGFDPRRLNAHLFRIMKLQQAFNLSNGNLNSHHFWMTSGCLDDPEICLDVSIDWLKLSDDDGLSGIRLLELFCIAA